MQFWESLFPISLRWAFSLQWSDRKRKIVALTYRSRIKGRLWSTNGCCILYRVPISVWLYSSSNFNVQYCVITILTSLVMLSLRLSSFEESLRFLLIYSPLRSLLFQRDRESRRTRRLLLFFNLVNSLQYVIHYFVATHLLRPVNALQSTLTIT